MKYLRNVLSATTEPITSLAFVLAWEFSTALLLGKLKSQSEEICAVRGF